MITLIGLAMAGGGGWGLYKDWQARRTTSDGTVGCAALLALGAALLF